MANGKNVHKTSNGNSAQAPKLPDSLTGKGSGGANLDADWNQVEPNVLRDILWAVSMLGGSVTFGQTKSGRAYSVKLYIGAPFDPLYFDGSAEGRAEMADFAERWVTYAAEQA